MSEAEVWTVGRLLTWTAQFLKDRGAESPRLDAEILLAEARGSRRIDLYTSFEEAPTEEVRTKFRQLVKQRAEGMPVAYLVGRREFYSLPFQVTRDVLIPRPETELLVVRLLDLLAAGAQQTPGETLHVADVGTGSGIIAICAAKRFANCHVTAIDKSAAAITIARANAEQHGVAERMEFVEGDLLSGLPAEPTFDFIASNPPYVSEAEFAQLARDVRDFEPRGALVSGPHGTEVIERLVPQAAERLKSGGHLLTEISPMIEADVRRLIESDARFELAPTIKDLAGHARVVQARRR
ncbi:MAG TPA: peptide chain release factor N(5)-glutamine methyltransferase [Pirellulales bacterium]|nr:peptide chain release factor N(5)-glutamine methyltransferase [Pirellulales bacterium]